MSKTTDEQRIKQLEHKAIKLFLDNTDWCYVIDMLSEEEQDEYEILMSGG